MSDEGEPLGRGRALPGDARSAQPASEGRAWPASRLTNARRSPEQGRGIQYENGTRLASHCVPRVSLLWGAKLQIGSNGPSAPPPRHSEHAHMASAAAAGQGTGTAGGVEATGASVGGRGRAGRVSRGANEDTLPGASAPQEPRSRRRAGRKGQHGDREAQREGSEGAGARRVLTTQGRRCGTGGPVRTRPRPAEPEGAAGRAAPCGRVPAQLSRTAMWHGLRSLPARDQDGSSTPPQRARDRPAAMPGVASLGCADYPVSLGEHARPVDVA